MKPLNTDEQYLYAIANGKPENLHPANRKEAYLKKIAEFHKRGGGAVDPSVITDAVNDYLDEHPVSGEVGLDDYATKESVTAKIENALGNRVFIGKSIADNTINDIFISTSGNNFPSTSWKVYVFDVSNIDTIYLGCILPAHTKSQNSKYRWAFYDTLITSENYTTMMTSEHCLKIAQADAGKDSGESLAERLTWAEILDVPTGAKCCLVSTAPTINDRFCYSKLLYDYADKSSISLMNTNNIASNVIIKFKENGLTKNTILDIVCKYSGDNKPSVIAKTSLATSMEYNIGNNGFYKRNTFRFPYELQDSENTIVITVPSGTTLDIKEMSVRFSNDNNVYDPLLKCHNGVLSLAPMNTAPAFEWAGKLGYKRLITQFRLTSDNVLVCVHDASINSRARNFDGTIITDTINVAEHTYQELLAYDYGLIKGSYWANTKLTTLEEYLDICVAYGMSPEFSMHVGDIGANNWSKFKQMLQDRHLLEKTIFKSFQKTVLQYAFDVFGDSIEGYGIDVSASNSISTAIADLESVIGQDFQKRKFIELDMADITLENVTTVKQSGYECHAWNVPTNIDDYIQAVSYGVSGFTDDINYQSGMLWK